MLIKANRLVFIANLKDIVIIPDKDKHPLFSEIYTSEGYKKLQETKSNGFVELKMSTNENSRK